MKALILVDIQNDFVTGGALAVPHGEDIVPVANRLADEAVCAVATQDWHPADHGSFASQHPGRGIGDVIDLNGLEQVLWPDHCVAGSTGADFVAALDRSAIREIFRKGSDPGVDSYSGFSDNGHRRATGLGDWLRSRQVDAVDIIGLATDYCVQFTALDAVAEGFRTTVMLEGVRGVELREGDCERAIANMCAAGVTII